MSAAFQLQPCGDPPPCSYPHCILEAFHEGDHAFKADRRVAFPISESNESLISHYGAGTRSYNRSAAKAEMDRRCEAAKERAALEPKVEYFAPLSCPCAQRPYAHELSVHLELRREAFNPAKRFLWPWSLMLSERRELSTERPA